MSNISPVTRRRFLSSASAAVTISAAGPIGFLQSTVPASAFAVEVQAVLTVGKLVAGAIDIYLRQTEYSWMTKVIRDLGVITKLASLKDATALMLKELESLTSEIDLLLRSQSV